MNSNNKAITEEFEMIFDSSINRLVKSVYNPEGSVETHLGQFTNLVTDTVVINDVSQFENSILSKIDHNILSTRLYNVIDNSIYNIELNTDNLLYSHNTGSIVHIGKNSVKSLSDIIDDIYEKLNNLGSYHGNSIMPVTYGISTMSDNISNTETKSYTLDNTVLFANKSQLMKMKLDQWQYLDIADGILCTYYDYNNVITINDEYVSSIKGLPGNEVIIKFDDKKKKGFYKIVLSRKDKRYLRIGKDELIRLKLICIENDPIYGTIWDVESYSVRNPEDISIVKK